MQGLHVKSIVKNSPKSTLVVAWDSPNQFPDKYTLVFQWLNNENEPSVFNRTGVSFLYILTIIMKTNR